MSVISSKTAVSPAKYTVCAASITKPIASAGPLSGVRLAPCSAGTARRVTSRSEKVSPGASS